MARYRIFNEVLEDTYDFSVDHTPSSEWDAPQKPVLINGCVLTECDLAMAIVNGRFVDHGSWRLVPNVFIECSNFTLGKLWVTSCGDLLRDDTYTVIQPKRTKNRNYTPGGFPVDILVGLAWVEGYTPNSYIRHKNGLGFDNRAENLEWVKGDNNNE